MHWAARKFLCDIHDRILTPAWRSQARKQRPTQLLYQLKITVVGVYPTVWRRIQVNDCTFDRLHELIQTVMGWTNSHLHHFDINGQLYGDPDLHAENSQEMMYRNSTITLISSVLTQENPGFRMQYEYDFGDSWEHEIVFEGCPEAVSSQSYPLCVEGQRACPPEDVGGVDGYAEFLKTIQTRNDPKRAETLEWAAGWFDPEGFNPATATKSMRKGIFDWRSVDDRL